VDSDEGAKIDGVAKRLIDEQDENTRQG